MTGDERLTFALAQLDRTQSLHGRIETRSAGLLTLNLAMAGIVALNLTPAIVQTHWMCVATVAVLLNAGAIAFLIALSFSHLSNKVRPSLLYFGDISRQSADEYIEKIKTVTPDDLLDDALCQIWRNSEILSMKFGRMQWAFNLTCGAIVPWLAFLFGDALHTGALPTFIK
jgi:hypothetical protein